MKEINLPTLEKQESIKQTVEGIASNFPLNISGGFNPFDYELKVFNATSSKIIMQNEAQTLLSISGSGIVTQTDLFLHEDWRYYAVVIFNIDGVDVVVSSEDGYTPMMASNHYSAYMGNVSYSLYKNSTPIAFKSNFDIKIKCVKTNAEDGLRFAWVSVLM